MIVYLLFQTDEFDDRTEFVGVFSTVELARAHVQEEHPGTEWLSSLQTRWTPRDRWRNSYRYEIQEHTVR